MGIVFACVGGSMGLSGALAFLGSLMEGGSIEFGLFALLPALFGCVFAAAGLWILYSSVRQWIARRKLRDLSVRLDRTRLRPGGEVDVAVHLRPSGELRVSRISARVRGVERCTSGSGTNKTTYTHTFHDLDYVLLDETSVGEGRAVDCGETMEIPADAPPSFKASSNVLGWSVTVKIALTGWPDWEQEYGLEVVG